MFILAARMPGPRPFIEGPAPESRTGENAEAMIYRELINKLNELGIIISFNGSFTQGIIEEIGDAVRAYLDTVDDGIGGESDDGVDVFSVFIEQSQNIRNYFLKRNGNGTFGTKPYESLILIGREEGRYFIIAGNFIDNRDVTDLMKHLERVNSFSGDELKNVYMNILGSSADGQSAGLGIIDMAMRSPFPLEYMFTPKGDRFSYFTLKVYI